MHETAAAPRRAAEAMLDREARELDRILREEAITPLFQPIVDAGCQGIFGYEALSRGPSDSPLHSPVTLFDTARLTGRLVELDLLCRRLAIEAFAALDLPGRLFLIVDADGRYRGLGQVIDLLREITALQVRNARQANPLTGLPGNEAINDTLAARLAGGEPFVAIYADLDRFKAYNDAYGYAQGDQVILAVGRLLQEVVGEAGFVGHVGGDDFMLVFDPEGARASCEAILERFARFIPAFYDQAHRQAGGLSGHACDPREGDVPLMTLSMAAYPVPGGSGVTAMEIASVLAELKGQAKRQVGNSLFIDRRGDEIMR